MTETATAFTGEVHPAAAVWPMLSEEELRDLADDIQQNGQQVPIVIDAEGRLLDGRNRLAACRIAGIEPEFRVHEGDPVALVLSAEKRRHQTPTQHAMGTALILREAGKRSDGRWERGSVPTAPDSTKSRTWTDLMMRSGVILDNAPDRVAEVIAGQPMDPAYRAAVEAKKKADRVAELPDDLAALVQVESITIDEAFDRVALAYRVAELPDDLAQRVNEGGISVDEAEAIQRERAQRIAALAARVRDALRTIGRMAGNPIPDDLGAHLNEAERSALASAVTAIERSGHAEALA